MEDSLIIIMAPVMLLPEKLLGIVTARTLAPPKFKALLLQAIIISFTGPITVAPAAVIQASSVGAQRRPVFMLVDVSLKPPSLRRKLEVGTRFQNLSMAGSIKSLS